MDKSKPGLVAHRGYALHFPENTLLALEEAIRAGAEYVEVDVQLSADRVPYLFHDRDLLRLCEQKGAIHDYTAGELNAFHASEPGRFGYKFVENPLTTLFGLVGLLQRNPAVTAFVELKRISLQKFGVAEVLRQVISVLTPVRKQCVIISYALDALQAVRSEYDWPVGAVIDDWNERKSQQLFDLNPQYLFCDLDTLPRKGEIKFYASRIAVFECTDPAVAMQLYARGVELVETFAIGEMIEKLDNASGSGSR
ncbi:MAG: glycerophosphodiester phosphodiesterase family protein [Gammaproteobacteria bacterium]|nr:glycerophosphodiester phosphodiesterase family protein [Gammaproteobacteria bacterium]MDH5651727.1 glycerophosphodiester phosphodiesterase family protein [Gammaproteobacteria bacterium]